MVCLAQPLDDDQLMNDPQSVVVTWATGVRDTGFTFTYKPNPEIRGIQQTVTTLRCLMLNYFHIWCPLINRIN